MDCGTRLHVGPRTPLAGWRRTSARCPMAVACLFLVPRHGTSFGFTSTFLLSDDGACPRARAGPRGARVENAFGAEPCRARAKRAPAKSGANFGRGGVQVARGGVLGR